MPPRTPKVATKKKEEDGGAPAMEEVEEIAPADTQAAMEADDDDGDVKGEVMPTTAIAAGPASPAAPPPAMDIDPSRDGGSPHPASQDSIQSSYTSLKAQASLPFPPPPPPPTVTGEGLTFRILYGAQDNEPLCYLLKVGEATILLDCGWDVQLDESMLESLLPVLAQVQLVLLSFPDLAHLGALPWVAKHLGPGVPIYSTQPVFKMGQMVLYDLYLSKCMDTASGAAGCPAFTLDDVDAAMTRFQLLKFSQPLEVRQQGRFYLSVTPYPAGRVLGGCFWRVNYKKVEEILYAVDFSLKSERHLTGAVEAFNALSSDKEQRPSLVIVDARPAQGMPLDERKVEAEFLDTVTATLRKGGNVLIPVETSGRVQELLLTLNGHWRTDRLLSGYKIVLLHHMARNVLHFTKSMVEWMHPEVIRAFDRSLRNPFTLKHVVPAQSMLELEAAMGEYRNPVVVLASDEGMDTGFSRALATRWASGAENALLLCGHLRKGSLAESFWKLRHLPKASLSFCVPTIERIVGEELAGLKEKEERERRRALEVEEFRRQAHELMEGTVGAAMDEEQESVSLPSSSLSSLRKVGASTAKRRRKTAAMYRRPRYLVFGCRDAATVEVDAYGEPLAEGECVDLAKAMAQETRGMLQGLALQGPSAGGGGVQRWGYLDDVLMTEGEAQVKAGTNALKFLMKESMVEVRWKVKAFSMEGRTDGKNLRAILQNLAPRRVIFVHGTQESFGELSRYVGKMLGGSTKVWTPPLQQLLQLQQLQQGGGLGGLIGAAAAAAAAAAGTSDGGPVVEGEAGAVAAAAAAAAAAATATAAAAAATAMAAVLTVQLQFDSKVLDVGLEEEGTGERAWGAGEEEDEKVPPLVLKEMGHYRLALVRAVASETSMDADGKPLVRCQPARVLREGGGKIGVEGEGEEMINMPRTRAPFLLADGDVLLTETSQRQSLRQKLREAGVNPEFQVGPEGASLICDGTTVVRVKDNRVTLEGPLSETYFRVREAIYSRFVAL
ncbi:cleavage and polyadenylation specificity factor subunit 2 [Nannochloropsis oceanica]